MLLKNLKKSRAERLRAQRSMMQAIRSAEERYVKGLRGITRAWVKAYMREVKSVVVARFDAALPGTFHMLGIRVEVAIENSVGPLFDRMSKDVSKSNAKQHQVYGITPKSTGLAPFIAERRRENIDLMKKAHGAFSEQLTALLTDEANFGMRSETLAARLAERGEVSEARAELIARDQTLTLNGQITEERQTSAGVESYVWSTSLDERVRDEHVALEGQTIAWSDPPDVGHPGDDVLCRCVAIAIVEDLADLF